VKNNMVCRDKGGVGFSALKQNLENNRSVGMCETLLVCRKVFVECGEMVLKNRISAQHKESCTSHKND